MKTRTRTCGACGKKFPIGGGHNARTCGKNTTHVGTKGENAGTFSGSHIVTATHPKQQRKLSIGEIFAHYEKVTGTDKTSVGETSTNTNQTIESSAIIEGSEIDSYTSEDLETLWMLQQTEAGLREYKVGDLSNYYGHTRHLTSEGYKVVKELQKFLKNYINDASKPANIHAFLKNFPPDVKQKLAVTENIPPNISIALLNDRSSIVRRYAVRNASTPRAAVSVMFNKVIKNNHSMANLGITASIVRRFDTSAEDLEKIYTYVMGEEKRGTTPQGTTSDGESSKEPIFRVSNSITQIEKEGNLRNSIVEGIALSPNSSTELFRKVLSNRFYNNYDIVLLGKIKEGKGSMKWAEEKINIVKEKNEKICEQYKTTNLEDIVNIEERVKVARARGTIKTLREHSPEVKS